MQQANPFDQFATDLGAAMPPPHYGGAPPAYGAPPPNPYGAPPPPPPPMYGGSPSLYGGVGGPEAYGGVGGGGSVYGGGGSFYGAPPPLPPQGPPPQGPPPAAPPGDPFGGFGAAAPPPPPQAPPPQDNPFGGPMGSFGGGAAAATGGGQLSPSPSFGLVAPPTNAPPPPAPPATVDPWGAPPPPPSSSYAGALVPAETQNNPYAQLPQQYPAQPSPFGPPPPHYGAPPPPPQPGYDQQQYGPPAGYSPYGGGPPPPGPGAMVPVQQTSMDPFSVFEAQSTSQAPPPPGPGAMVPMMQQQQQQSSMVPAVQSAPAADDDFWGAFSASPPPGAAAAPTAEERALVPASGGGTNTQQTGPTKNTTASAGELPPGGEMYDARIFTPTLGVMFFKPQELTDSLFLNTDKNLVDGLGERPVVAFIVEGSSARSAGVELGHVLLKVNGVDVKNPKEASRLIKEGPRPLPLLFYVPNTDVVIAEGEHMVKYDTRETTAPGSAKDWKPKYCVVGGIIAQPWMLNMYRSKSEYDIAVIETQARRPVSVKVKQFSLQGARIQNDWQGPQMVKYKNKLHPWKYIVVLPVARNPIKISSPNLASLKPVHEGIRRVLLAQQRDRGTKSSRDHDQQQDYDAQRY